MRVKNWRSKSVGKGSLMADLDARQKLALDERRKRESDALIRGRL